MKAAKISLTEKTVFRWFILLLLPLAISLSLNFPINVDEILHYNHSKLVIEWYRTGGEDQSCLDTPWSNLKYYGQSVDNLTAVLNDWLSVDDEYKTRHITGAVFAWLLILLTSLIAYEISGRYRTAIITALILILIPAVMGQYCNNLKDIPFAAGYSYAILYLIRFIKNMPRVPWKYTIHLSLAIAFLNSVRIGGLIIYPYFGLFILLWLIKNKDFRVFSSENRRLLQRFLAQGLVIVIVGYFLGLIFWPYGLINPIKHPFESLSLMEHYSISIRQLFGGEWYWSTALPVSYLLIWLLISLPELVLSGIVLYFVTRIKGSNRLLLSEFIVIFSLLFPFLYVALIQSNLYSGWRQMYFIAGPISVIAALGIDRALYLFSSRKVFVFSMAVVLFFASLLPLLHYFRNTDTAYVYFNSLAGGKKKAWSNYEYDYYWHGMKKAVEWLDAYIPEDDTDKIIASNFDISVYLGHRSDIKSRYIHYDDRSTVSWDYGLFGLSFIHPYQMKNDHWKPYNTIKIVSDKRNPLVVITQRLNTNDFDGIELARAGKYEEAIPLLQRALAADPNNSRLFEILAESFYMLEYIDECIKTIGEGKALHPWNERINMIEAQIDFDNGRYEEALEKCLFIVKNNSKYYNIASLLASCYEKTGDTEAALKLRNKLRSH